MPRINQIESLRVLKAVVECGSFTAASQRLGVSAARVSKSIERLEHELGTVLFNRSTRHMQITDGGQHCYERALNLLGQWQDLKEELEACAAKPRGNLRISAPMTWGLARLAPVLDDFMLEFPDISLDVQLNDQHVNVLAEQFDLVLRLTHQLTDSTLICRKITDYQMVVCASPAYLAARGEPQHPSELKDHACLMYSQTGAARKWLFTHNQKPLDVYLEPTLLSNNSKLLHSALLAGRGIALIPDFIVAEDLATKRLLPILPSYQTTSLMLYSLRPGNRIPPHRLKILHDYLYQRLKEQQP